MGEVKFDEWVEAHADELEPDDIEELQNKNFNVYMGTIAGFTTGMVTQMLIMEKCGLKEMLINRVKWARVVYIGTFFIPMGLAVLSGAYFTREQNLHIQAVMAKYSPPPS